MRVLVTGAAGRIGSELVEHLDGVGEQAFDLRLADLEVEGVRGHRLDITDLEACREACRGMEAVVHLAALPSPDTPFEALLPVNVVGTYNVFRAAADAGVRRMVYASSVQAVEGYPVDVQVRGSSGWICPTRGPTSAMSRRTMRSRPGGFASSGRTSRPRSDRRAGQVVSVRGMPACQRHTSSSASSRLTP